MTEEKILMAVPDTLRKVSDRDRIILVLDMDETLVHTRKTVRPNHGNFIAKNGQIIEKRPHVDEFLRATS